MNKLLCALLLLPLVATAKPIAETNNQGGGRIVLTNDKCNDPNFKLAYSQMNGASTLLGCWGMDNTFIHIRWYDGDLRSYPIEGFRMIEAVKPTM
jgi:hypothetical protein